ncbi:TolB family protein [Flavihumibacter sp. UBA7668]|uniref:TolB family protein n=1 Tax=Flavihumibacter sp. UBA7668 TaxID=1946542 RepID=UPI0025C6F84F|nr:hypothetical protein [Flavihumibacter sp. UBA7668]
MKLSILPFLLLVYFSAESQSFEPIPVIFGEGTISSKDFEFNAAFTQDNKTVFFTKALLPDWRKMTIVFSELKGNKWGKPKLASFSGQYKDADPVITADGKKIIFISDRPSPLKNKPTDYNLWFVEKIKNEWSEPQLLEGGFYKETPSPLYPSIANNGNLYYCSSTNTDSDIYVTKLKDGKYGEPVKLDFNSPLHRDIDPAVAPDESFIIFTSLTRKGYGAADLWISFNLGEKWSEPVNLGKTINSFDKEGQAAISRNGKKLYFTSSRNKLSNFSESGKKMNQKVFKDEFNSIFNGLPNIWEVDISTIHALKSN